MPEYIERKFVDPTPWMPPLYDVEADAFFMPARTRSDETVEEVQDPNYTATISIAGQEPGPSEFSHGRGLVAPTELADPSLSEELRAVYRTNPADPGDVANFERADREWAGTRQLPQRHIARVREPGTLPDL